ncbi:MAG: ROK family protein [Verrucomicrobiota bacterium]|nr:ROK family transcriptional regulator [Limisphaera sp.]MDW8381100.1 ROK family protein [Verrucomicrobiota bacterium]
MIVVPAHMGRMNKLALLNRLRQLGTASRAELAKSLGLSQPTCGKIVQELLRFGVVEELHGHRTVARKKELPARRPRLGRPGVMLRLDQTRPRFFGVQLDVTHTSLARLAVGFTGPDQWEVRVPTGRSARDWIRQLQEATRALPMEETWGVLISVPGLLDAERGRVLFSPNLHWTESADLRAIAWAVWRSPVVLMQEEQALALGHYQVNPEQDSFLLVDFGEGVGGAVLVHGRLPANPLPVSGELGHTPIPGNTRRCGCGAVGCLETLVSLRGLLTSFREAVPGASHSWEALWQHVQQHGVEPWLARTLDATAVVIAGALNVMGLQQVVLTGLLTELPESVIRHLTDRIREGALWARFGEIQVVAAPRHRAAGLVAAGIEKLVLNRLGEGSPGHYRMTRGGPVLDPSG